MVLRYKNPNPEPILGAITITPDNPLDTEQNFLVQFKPSHEPSFTTVSGPSGSIPSPLVMNPGHWSVSIKNEKSLFLVSTVSPSLSYINVSYTLILNFITFNVCMWTGYTKIP